MGNKIGSSLAALMGLAFVSCNASADDNPHSRPSGRLLLTGGVSQIEGSAGGGLVPWALIGGYGTRDQIGATGYATYVKTDDFNLKSYGALASFSNRLEISVARQDFDLEDVGTALGLGAGFTIRQTTVGAKLRLFGDAVLEQDSWMPQVSVGIQYKDNNQDDLVRSLGAKSGNGTDFYLSASKLFLAQSILANGTLRLTKANQYGILGFGSDTSGYSTQLEGSVAYLLSRKFAIGGEYRFKPDNLAVAKEENAFDVFMAYAPTKNVSVTLAYADLGNIVVGSQKGLYASLQVGF